MTYLHDRFGDLRWILSGTVQCDVDGVVIARHTGGTRFEDRFQLLAVQSRNIVRRACTMAVSGKF